MSQATRYGGEAAALAAVFDEGAGVYEAEWAPALVAPARRLVERVDAPEAKVVLDLAGGTGTLLPALQQAFPKAQAVILDRSLGMLRRAPARAPRVHGDALALPMADGSVDVVVAAFVLFLLPDAAQGAAEVARVLRPGGWLAAATWGEGGRAPAEALIDEALTAAGAPAAQPPAPRSDELTNSPAAMRALLETAGLVDVVTETAPLDWTYRPESLLTWRSEAGVGRQRFQSLPEAARGELLDGLRARLRRLPPEDLIDRTPVLSTWARKPN